MIHGNFEIKNHRKNVMTCDDMWWHEMTCEDTRSYARDFEMAQNFMFKFWTIQFLFNFCSNYRSRAISFWAMRWFQFNIRRIIYSLVKRYIFLHIQVTAKCSNYFTALSVLQFDQSYWTGRRGVIFVWRFVTCAWWWNDLRNSSCGFSLVVARINFHNQGKLIPKDVYITDRYNCY